MMRSAPPRATLTQAFVLHRRDYGDSSLLLEVFAAGRGRFAAIAKGARRARDAAGALLQPFQPLWVAAVGRGEVRTLTHVEAAGAALTLQGRPLLCGFYVNELLMRMLGRDDPHDPLFAFYHAALGALAQAEDLEGTLRGFELRLLDELGYALALDVDIAGDPVRPERRYALEPGAGMCPVPADACIGRPHAPGVGGGTLLALARGERLAPPGAREARDLLRQLLEPHLGGRPLKSREVFRRLVQGAQRCSTMTHQREDEP